MPWPETFTQEVHQRLLAPFPDGVVQWRENRYAYIEARDVMCRLDEVVGPGNWHFHCEVIPHQQGQQIGAVVKGSLTVLGVTREEIGEHWRASDKDKMEVYKAAVSDALKRCAVHFGISRYLYELEVKRQGQMTPAEANAAAKKAGYEGTVSKAPEKPTEAPKTASGADGPPPVCADCGTAIVAVGPMSAEAVVALGVQRFGRPLCPPCGKSMKEMEPAERVPDGELVPA